MSNSGAKWLREKPSQKVVPKLRKIAISLRCVTTQNSEDLLTLVSVSKFYVQNHKTTKSNRDCRNCVIIMKGCTFISEPVLKCIVGVSESEKHISAEMIKTVIIPVYKKGNNACVQNYRRTRVSPVNNLLIVLDHLSYYSMVN
jgi:hypothetical protein